MLPCFTVTIPSIKCRPPLVLSAPGGVLSQESQQIIRDKLQAEMGSKWHKILILDTDTVVPRTEMLPTASTTYWVAAADRWSAVINVIERLCHDDMNLDDFEYGFRVKDVSDEQSEDPFFMTLLAMRRNQGDAPGILYCSDEVL